jgi:excisionase family DNA binding protein
MHEIPKPLADQLDRIENALLLSKKVLNFEECCAYTGIGKVHMYRLTANRCIPHSKPFGKRLYFDRDEINAWLMQGKVSIRKTL